jgi:hypothetical protein
MRYCPRLAQPIIEDVVYYPQLLHALQQRNVHRVAQIPQHLALLLLQCSWKQGE